MSPERQPRPSPGSSDETVDRLAFACDRAERLASFQWNCLPQVGAPPRSLYPRPPAPFGRLGLGRRSHIAVKARAGVANGPAGEHRPRRRRTVGSESQGAAAASPDTSVYGFCYEACATDRAVGSCGTPAPGETHAPMEMCKPIEFNPTLSAIIGPQLGTGASPFVDDNKSADPAQQPAGYTFLGQFIDHDVTRTQTALSATNALSSRAQGDAGVRAKIVAAGVTLDQLKQVIANAAAPSSALSLSIPASSTSTASTGSVTLQL